MVTGTELFGQMRGRVHRDRREDQNLRVSGVLRDAVVQRFQRWFRPVLRVLGRLSSGSFPAPEHRVNAPPRLRVDDRPAPARPTVPRRKQKYREKKYYYSIAQNLICE